MDYIELKNYVVSKIPFFNDSFLFKYNYYVKKPVVPYSVQIELTNVCNFDCKMCYNRSGDTGFMDMGLYRGIVDEISENGVQLINPYWRGESLLHPHVIDMVKYAKQKGLKVHLTTNGSMLTKEMSKKLIHSGLDLIRISFYSTTRETFKEIYGRDFYDKCLGNIQNLIRIRSNLNIDKPRIVVGVLIMKDNYEEVGLIKDLFNPCPDGFCYSNCSYHPFTMSYDGRVIKNDSIRTTPCNSLFKTLSIMWDGRVTTCCVDSDCKLILGYAEDGVIDAFNSERMKQYRMFHLNGEFNKMSVCRFCV